MTTFAIIAGTARPGSSPIGFVPREFFCCFYFDVYHFRYSPEKISLTENTFIVSYLIKESHGFGGNSRIWKYQIPLLSKYFNVLTVDLPSHNEGNLRLSQIDVTLDAISREILAVCDHYSVNAIFMGVSLGTVFVKYIEAFYPEYVDFGILVGAVATVNAFFTDLQGCFQKLVTNFRLLRFIMFSAG